MVANITNAPTEIFETIYGCLTPRDLNCFSQTSRCSQELVDNTTNAIKKYVDGYIDQHPNGFFNNVYQRIGQQIRVDQRINAQRVIPLWLFDDEPNFQLQLTKTCIQVQKCLGTIPIKQIDPFDFAETDRRFNALSARQLDAVFLSAFKQNLVQCWKGIISSAIFSKVSSKCLNSAFEDAALDGNFEYLKAFISSKWFPKIFDDNLGICFVNTQLLNHFECFKAIINSERFPRIPINYVISAFWFTVFNGQLEFLKEIVSSVRVQEIPHLLLRAIEPRVSNLQCRNEVRKLLGLPEIQDHHCTIL